MTNKQKVRNVLRQKMGWLHYEIGDVSNPFGKEGEIHLAVKTPKTADAESRIIDVYLPENYESYNYLAHCIHHTKDNRIDIKPPTGEESNG